MNITARDKKLIMIFLGLVLLLLSYFLVYQNFSDKTDALKTKITTLSAKLTELQGYSANLKNYESGIAKNKSAVTAAMQRYPNDVRPEDYIVLGSQMERDIGLNVKSAAFGKATPVYGVTSVADKGGDYSQAPAVKPLMAYKNSSSLSVSMTYTQLKKALQAIYSQDDVTTLENLTVSYDNTTGELLGNFTIDKYYITGADDTYKPTVVPHVDIGKQNLFGTAG